MVETFVGLVQKLDLELEDLLIRVKLMLLKELEYMKDQVSVPGHFGLIDHLSLNLHPHLLLTPLCHPIDN